MKRQFSEENRPNIEVEFLYIKRSFYGLRFINHGKCTAQQVKICLDTDFINSITETSFSDLLKNQKNRSCIIGVGQHYDLFFGSNKYLENPLKTPAKGLVQYKANGIPYESEFYIDLENYATIFSTTSEQEDLIKKIGKQILELKMLRQELSSIEQCLQGLLYLTRNCGIVQGKHLLKDGMICVIRLEMVRITLIMNLTE